MLKATSYHGWRVRSHFEIPEGLPANHGPDTERIYWPEPRSSTIGVMNRTLSSVLIYVENRSSDAV